MAETCDHQFVSDSGSAGGHSVRGGPLMQYGSCSRCGRRLRLNVDTRTVHEVELDEDE